MSCSRCFEEKLAQYLSGTVFALDVRMLDAQTASTVTARIRKVAEARQIVVR